MERIYGCRGRICAGGRKRDGSNDVMWLRVLVQAESHGTDTVYLSVTLGGVYP